MIAPVGAGLVLHRRLGLGVAYTFGMVAPLFVLALVWERRDWAANRLFGPGAFPYLRPRRASRSGVPHPMVDVVAGVDQTLFADAPFVV